MLSDLPHVWPQADLTAGTVRPSNTPMFSNNVDAGLFVTASHCTAGVVDGHRRNVHRDFGPALA